MLILSRRPGDAILIDGGIRIVVLASGQRSVRLGIEAPAEVGIVREEIASRPDARRAQNAAELDADVKEPVSGPAEDHVGEGAPEPEGRE
ncbi:MAG: carbon storage regulator [Gemmatimonadetes bacterium]|nr:carbon storage regulator [Gemmatimonadota bacterium]